MVFDEKAQEWKPRYGYKRVNDPKEDWVLEVPQNSGLSACTVKYRYSVKISSETTFAGNLPLIGICMYAEL